MKRIALGTFLGSGLCLVPALVGEAWVRGRSPEPVPLELIHSPEGEGLDGDPGFPGGGLEVLAAAPPRVRFEASTTDVVDGPFEVEDATEIPSTLLTLVVVDDAGVPVQGLWARPWSVRQDAGSVAWHRNALDALTGTLEIRGLRSGRHSIDVGGLGVVSKTWELRVGEPVAGEPRVEERGDAPVFIELQRGWPVQVEFIDAFGSNVEDLGLRVLDVDGTALPFTWTPAPGARGGDACSEGWSDGGMPHSICEGRGEVGGLPFGRYRLEYELSNGFIGSWAFEVLRDRPTSITVDV